MNNPRYVRVKLYYQQYEREMCDGYFPLTECGDEMTHIQETFYLDSNGCWHQQTIYDLHNNAAEKVFASKFTGLDEYAAIKGLDGDCGMKDAHRQCRSNELSRSTRGAAVAAINAQKYLEKYRHFHHLRQVFYEPLGRACNEL